MSQPARPTTNPVVVLREEFDDWAILFNPDSADVVGINPIGVAIWKLMDGRRTLRDIADQVRTRFADAPDSTDDEVAAFVDDLCEQGFVGYDAAEAVG